MGASNMADQNAGNYDKIDFCTLGMFIIGMPGVILNTFMPLRLSR
jgi:hypothetical protein